MSSAAVRGVPGNHGLSKRLIIKRRGPGGRTVAGCTSATEDDGSAGGMTVTDAAVSEGDGEVVGVVLARVNFEG